MGLFNNFPYTNLENINLDYTLRKLDELYTRGETLYANLTEWKEGVDADLAQWKEETEAAIDTDLGEYKDEVTAAFADLTDALETHLAEIETTAIAARDAAAASALAASGSATAAAGSSDTAIKFATGVDSQGDPVSSDDPAYHNNSKYYAESIASETAQITTNTTDIADLKSALNSKDTLNGQRTIVNTTPIVGYVQANDNGNIGINTTNQNNCYLDIDVLPGEVYEFTGKTYSNDSPNRKALIFGDTNNKWITTKTGEFIREKVAVPSGAVKMYINGRIDSIYLPAVYKITENFSDAVNDTLIEEHGTYTYNDFDTSELTEYDGFLKYDSPNTANITSGTNYHHIIIPVSAGEHYIYFNDHRRDFVNYEVVNSINCRCLRGQNIDTTTGAEIVIPDAGAKLIINYVSTDVWKIQKGTVSLDFGGNTVTNIYGGSSIINTPTVAGIGTEKWNYLFADNFVRADSDTSLGNPGNNVYDKSYTALIGVLGISGNKAYKVSGATGIAYQETGVSDCCIDFMIDTTNIYNSPFGTGIAFRIKDADNYNICVISQGQSDLAVQCFKFTPNPVSGNIDRERILHATMRATTGVERFTLEMEGSRLALYVNGVLIQESISSFNATETKHGIAMFGTNTTGYVRYFDIRKKVSWENVVDTLDNGVIPYYCSLEHVSGAEHSFKFVDSPVKNSLKSMEFCVKKSDNYKRSEMSFPRVKQLGEQIISFDMMLGDDYRIQDPDDGIIWQFHDSPEDNSAIPENAGIGPNLSCRISGGNYIIHTQYSSAKPATSSNLTPVNITLIDDPLDDIGNWVHWEIHVKWGYESFFDPFVYIYKDGTLVYSRIGVPNTVNATLGSYFKIGPYPVNYVLQPDQGTSVSRTMWVDNLVFTN